MADLWMSIDGTAVRLPAANDADHAGIAEHMAPAGKIGWSWNRASAVGDWVHGGYSARPHRATTEG